MFLQLHDGPGMASQNYPSVRDLNLPDAIKIPKRQILLAAVDEAGAYALKALETAKQKNSTKEDLPTLSLDNLEELEALIEEPDGTFGLGAWWIKAATFILTNGEAIYKFSKNFANTVALWRVNNKIQNYYDANYYQVQDLNNLSPQQIDEQLALISGDLLNATAQKDDLDAMALSRFSQVYQQRKIMLPAFSSTTLMYAGAALLLYFLIKK
jgi:hypothetical protein